MIDAFADFVLRATDQAYGPYPYQEQLAAEGFPQVLRVPTGAGKTMAAVLPWVWRRNVCPEETPRRLVYVLPLRGLVEQTVGHITTWLSRVGMSNEVGVHVLMGGVDRDDSAWQSHPDKSAILVGTQDMVLSRALMRGYAEPRPRWPISFALLHTDTQWVFDETQLLGPALPTSIQLQAFRDRMGTATPTATMWMSATLSPEDIATIDHAPATRVMQLSLEDRHGPLKRRLDATRTVHRLNLTDDTNRYPAEVAAALADHHRAGTRTIGVFNTVDRAAAVYEQLLKAAPDADLLLVHSRFRPVERRAAADRLAAELSQLGRSW
ncbi:DEAD/DEAH box helicase [Streptosporangium lutulentum]